MNIHLVIAFKVLAQREARSLLLALTSCEKAQMHSRRRLAEARVTVFSAENARRNRALKSCLR